MSDRFHLTPHRTGTGDGAERDLHHVPPVHVGSDGSERTGVEQVGIPGVLSLHALADGEAESAGQEGDNPQSPHEAVAPCKARIDPEADEGRQQSAPDLGPGFEVAVRFPEPVVGEVEPRQHAVGGIEGVLKYQMPRNVTNNRQISSRAIS